MTATQRIMITGAAGFIGYHLAVLLNDRPHNHLLLVDTPAAATADRLYDELAARPRIDRYEVDLCDPAAVATLPAEVDVIYHLAAINGTRNFYEQPYAVMRSGTLPTFNLVERYVKPGKLRRFVYAGTPESYASTVSRFGWPVPTDESVPLCIDDIANPRWSYAISKTHGEVLTVNACRSFGTAYSIVRYHNVFGPRMGDKHVIPDFLHRLRNGIAELHGHRETRTFLYVADAVAATEAIAESEAAANEIVNVGGDTEITISELAAGVMSLLGRAGEPITLRPAPAGSVARRAPSTDKLRKLVGFEPSWSLAEGLLKTIEFHAPELLAGAA
jgi:UDP-glucose 4-epimerase